MKMLDIQTAEKIIDFKGGQKELAELAKIQLEGAVALHNMIADPEIGIGYLADEVGMGKTYIALGIVALMRYFNPSLRVLYICPSRNVQEKWERDYLSFIEHNVIVAQNRIRTIDGKPAAPYIPCNSVRELIQSSSLGFYADFFIRKDSFSIGMNDDDSEHKAYWWSKIEEIEDLLPAKKAAEVKIKRNELSKKAVKDLYAEALNYILPTFDLVVIDEAHNFKHPKGSSDRNRVLSKVLGFDDEGVIPRVKNSLLLSATPYDREIEQLRNQLKLIGKGLILDGLKNDQPREVECILRRFMVRRLNQIEIDQKPHTRNMYRTEHRSGDRAEINFASSEQKLVMALVQKKVGELLDRQSSTASFQTGMLASFESFAQSTKSEPVKFDGDDNDKSDAQDRHVIDHIVDSYKEEKLGTTLPHPKMDSVCDQLKTDALGNARKQLVFVRRVMSVKELKNKLDDHYNEWLITYIKSSLSGYAESSALFQDLYAEYQKISLKKDADVTEGEYKSETSEADDKQPPKNDTFFAWFFRGSLDKPAVPIMEAAKVSTPDNIRKSLAAKKNRKSLLFEPNWAIYLCLQEGLDLQDIIEAHCTKIADLSVKYQSSELQSDELDRFRACQLGFIEWLIEDRNKTYLQPLLDFLKQGVKKSSPEAFSAKQLKSFLLQETLFTVIAKQNLEFDLYPYQKAVYRKLRGDDDAEVHVEKLLNKLYIHTLLVSLCLRTGHGVVDLFLSFLRTRASDDSESANDGWIQDLVTRLKKQKSSQSFSTFYELKNTALHLDLIIKTNIPEVYQKDRDALRLFISKRLNPVSPVIGASGETVGNRSAQARKFRMPGYPLILISTDVFQEGEDLHTFCDSVVHYGISNSPVSIEQKTGRVDRVAALSHRNLISDHRIERRADDMIQVSFPHVKQSIELLQVRQLCKDINEFLESLHKVSSQKNSGSDKTHVNEAIGDKSSIPGQIVDFLETPYPAITDQVLPDSQLDLVLQQGKNAESLHKHTMGLVDDYRKEHVESIDSSLSVILKSARISGETILSARTPGEEIDINSWTMTQLKKEMYERSCSTHHRVCVEATAKSKYKLYDDVEMFVGDHTTTQQEDIQDFFGRFSATHNSQLIPAKSPKVTAAYNHSVSSGYLRLNADCMGFPCEPIEDAGCDGVMITFNEGTEGQRQHKVYIYESDKHCVFLSKAVSRKHIDSIDEHNRVEKVVDYTWGRNYHTDIVEFYLDQDGDISGRAIHPVISLDQREFEYCIYALAVQADRLEYVFSKQDKH